MQPKRNSEDHFQLQVFLREKPAKTGLPPPLPCVEWRWRPHPPNDNKQWMVGSPTYSSWVVVVEAQRSLNDFDSVSSEREDVDESKKVSSNNYNNNNFTLPPFRVAPFPRGKGAREDLVRGWCSARGLDDWPIFSGSRSSSASCMGSRSAREKLSASRSAFGEVAR